jgi:hypothetical protein
MRSLPQINLTSSKGVTVTADIFASPRAPLFYTTLTISEVLLLLRATSVLLMVC